MAALLAAISATAYGVGDFLGGLSARRMAAVTATLCDQLVGLLVVLVLAGVVGGSVTATDLWWGGAAGLSVATALVLFYWALGAGQMSVVAPTSALMSALVPLAVGLVGGDRPSTTALAGALVALPAIVLISREPGDPRGPDEPPPPTGRSGRRVLAASLLAGVCFGGFFVCISRAGGGSGLWPLTAARLSAVVALGLATAVVRPGRPDPVGLRFAASAGVFSVGANALFLVASRLGLLSLVGVIGAMYPASTVVLARSVLKERMARHQLVGLGLAALALVAVGLG